MLEILFWILLPIAVILALAVFFLLSKTARLEQALSELKFSKASQSVKYGKMTEQLIPFAKDFPFSPENFRFLGNPIDGVAFEDDKIVFAEFKAASSQLSEKQRRIRELVERKKIEWLEFRVK